MARDFDGSASYLQIADGDSFGSLADWTVGGWVNLDAAGNSGASILAHVFTASSLPIVLCIGTTGTGTEGNWTAGHFNITGTVWSTVTDSIACPLRRWTHIVGRKDSQAATLTLFRDGVAVGKTTSVPATPSISAGAALRMGRRWDASGIPFMDGRLQDVFVYKQALTDDEVARLYLGDSPLSLRGAALMSYWPLDDYSGAKDAVGAYPMVLGAATALVPGLPYNTPTKALQLSQRPGRVIRANVVSGIKAINTYNELILKDQPAAYWPMNDVSGPGVPKLDFSINKRHFNVASASLSMVVDNSDHIVDRTPFNISTTGYAYSTPTVVLSGTANITLECWIKLIANPLNDTAVIYNGNGGANGYGIVIDANRTIQLLRGGIAYGANSTSVVPLNRWTHIALTRGATQWLYWINGVQDATNPGTSNPGAPGTNSHVNICSGQMCCAAMYASELTGNQLLSHYYAGLSKRDTFDAYAGGESSLAPIVLPISGIGII